MTTKGLVAITVLGVAASTLAPTSPALADSGLYGHTLPSGCNYENAPRQGCVLAMKAGRRVSIQPFRFDQKAAVVKIRRNGHFYAKFRSRYGNQVQVPYQNGRFRVKVRFIGTKQGTSYAYTRFTVTDSYN